MRGYYEDPPPAVPKPIYNRAGSILEVIREPAGRAPRSGEYTAQDSSIPRPQIFDDQPPAAGPRVDYDQAQYAPRPRSPPKLGISDVRRPQLGIGQIPHDLPEHVFRQPDGPPFHVVSYEEEKLRAGLACCLCHELIDNKGEKRLQCGHPSHLFCALVYISTSY